MPVYTVNYKWSYFNGFWKKNKKRASTYAIIVQFNELYFVKIRT